MRHSKFSARHHGLSFLLACLPMAVASNGAANALDRNGATDAHIVDFSPISVQPRKEGPLIWRAQRGSRVIWVLPVPKAAPRSLAWDWSTVHEKIAASGRVVGPSRVSFSFDLGPLQMLSMYRRAKDSKLLPQHKTLRDVLDPADHVRWRSLASKYTSDLDEMERMRPHFAASRLYAAALSAGGLKSYDEIVEDLYQTAEKLSIPRSVPRHRITISDVSGIDDGIRLISDDEISCFRSSLDMIEQFPAAELRQANAWATGDVDAMAFSPIESSLRAHCEGMMAGPRPGSSLTPSSLARGRREAWLMALEQTSTADDTVFAILPTSLALGEEGYLEALEASGYEITYQ